MPSLAVLAAIVGVLALAPAAQAASTAAADLGQLVVHGDAGDDAIAVEYRSSDDRYVVTAGDGIAPDPAFPGDTGCDQVAPDRVACDRIEAFGAFAVHVDGHAGDDTLTAGYGGDPWHFADTAGLVGGPGGDFVGGSPNADGIGGGEGDDLLDGAAGDDDLTGGPEAGADVVYGGPGSDSLSDGEDDAAAGSDELDGGVCPVTVAGCAVSGVDAANDEDRIGYSRAAGVVVDLAEEAGNGAPGEDDTLRDFESVVTGEGPDRVTGSPATNEIASGGGDDSLTVSGDPGSADSVQCGTGADTLTADADDAPVDCESVAGIGDGDGDGGGGAGGGGADGGNAGGGGAVVGGAAQHSASDTTGPAVVVPSRNRTITATRKGRFGFRVGPFAEDATGVVALRAKRGRVPRLGRRSFQAKAGQTKVVRFTLSRRSRSLLANRRRMRMVATITARDALGNATTRRFVFTLRAAG